MAPMRKSFEKPAGWVGPRPSRLIDSIVKRWAQEKLGSAPVQTDKPPKQGGNQLSATSRALAGPAGWSFDRRPGMMAPLNAPAGRPGSMHACMRARRRSTPSSFQQREHARTNGSDGRCCGTVRRYGPAARARLDLDGRVREKAGCNAWRYGTGREHGAPE